MPTFISKRGKWYAAPERVVNPNTGDIYEGPDRAASEVIKESGAEHLGQDSAHDPEIIVLARQLGMTPEEWFKIHDTEEGIKKAEEAQKNAVTTHAPPKRKKGVQPQGGGVNKTGGFGDLPA